jgi:choloylglycine hydrolase
MCTAISYRRGDNYFGRNLDVEFTFNEQVAVTPRKRLFHLRSGEDFRTKYAMIGIAAVVEDYPLYYEAANEAGLAGAGLNFPGNARYLPPAEGMVNITPFEFLPWILGQAESCDDVRRLLSNLNFTNIRFADSMPLSPLHFMFSDSRESIVAEPMEDGIHVYDNPFDVMTNNPPFSYHLCNMNNYLNLSAKNSVSRFSTQYPLENYGVGMGALGLPGDASSASRFVRAAFNLTNSRNPDNEAANVGQFFHVLDSVAMVSGATLTDAGKDDITLYSCCINTDKGIFYYKTYGNSRITAVRMDESNMNGDKLTVFPLRREQSVLYEN